MREASSVDWSLIRDEVERIRVVVEQYDLDDIYNGSTQISCTKFLHKNIARGFHHPPQMEHMGQIFSEQRLLGANT